MLRLAAGVAMAMLAAGPVHGAHPAEALINQAADAQRTAPDKVRELADQALTLLATQPDADLEIRARLQLCEYASERDRAEGERQVEAVMKLLPAARRQGLRAGALSCQGEMLESAGENVQAMESYEQAVSTAEAAGEVQMLADALYQRGYLRGVLGDFANGLADLKRARAQFEKLGLEQHALTTLNGIAILYNRLGDYAQARSYFEQTLAAQEAAGMAREVAVTVHNLGRVQERQGDWEAARQSFEKTLTVSREIDYPRGQAYALRGLASVRNAHSDARGALQLLTEAQRQFGNDELDVRLRAQILLERGKALRQLQRLGESLAALRQAALVFREADSLAEMAMAYEELSLTQAEAGDWRGAYESGLAFKGASDRLFRQQLDQRFAVLKVDFDTAATQQQNALLLREKAVTDRALAQQRRANRFQAAAIILGLVLAGLLAGWAMQQRRARERMQALALLDELTGLSNRRSVLAQLAALLNGAEARRCAVLILDLDHFKPINDRFGHPAGDAVLREVARALSATVREPAFLGRLGGEEFLVAIPDSDLPAAMQVAERLREAIAAIDMSAWFTDRGLTASLGVTVSVPGRDTLSSVLKRADDALYEAKHGGRNQVVAGRQTAAAA